MAFMVPPAMQAPGMAGAPPMKKARMSVPPADGIPEGEVRFEQAISVQQAAAMAGSMLGGSPITVMPDATSKDGTKIIVKGFGAQVRWQELKDHFKACGAVVHADVKGKVSNKRDIYPSIGEVRFSTAQEAQQAINMLNGSQLMGAAIEVKLHSGSTDATKLAISGIPPGCAWQELKDHFASCGTVMHAGTTPVVPGQQITGEVRFEDPQHAQLALRTLNGSTLGSTQIFVAPDPGSTDQTKVTVTGIAPGTDWQALKDHFASMGTIAFADIHKGSGKGGKGWNGGGKGGGGAMWGGGGGAMWGGGKGAMGGMGAMGAPMMMPPPGKGGFGAKGGFGMAAKGGQAPGQATQFPRVPGALTGTVRYEAAYSAQMAAQQMNGQMLNGGQLTVDLDWNSADGTKLWVGGIPPGTGWQDLKDFFSQCGPLAYANVNTGKGKGK